MLREKRNDLFHLLNLLESIGKIEKYLTGVSSAEDFINQNDQLIYNATLTLLANISESLLKLSDDTQAELNGVDINLIRGMRNRIVHDYAGLDSFIVYDVAKNKLGLIGKKAEECVASNLNSGKFDMEEYNVSKSGTFYRHVHFKDINTAS